MCFTYHCFFRSLVSFDSLFSSMPCIAKFSLSIPEGNQELFCDKLQGQFPQDLSFSSCMDSRHFILRHLSVSADQYNRSGRVQKCFSCFNHKKCKTLVGKRPGKMMLETRLGASPSKDGWWDCMCSYNPAEAVFCPSYFLGTRYLKAVEQGLSQHASFQCLN